MSLSQSLSALLAALLVAAGMGHAAPAVGAQPSAEPTGEVTAPIVFYRTIGEGFDRLYRRVLDGVHLPELVAARPAGYADDQQGAWWVSPDGSVTIHLGVLTGSRRDEDRVGGLEAIPIRTGAPAWRLEGRRLDPQLSAWSDDGRWLSDGRSLTNVTSGTTQDLTVPEDWTFRGFVVGDDGLIYESGDVRARTVRLWRLEPGTSDLQPVSWGSVATTGTTWPAETSTVLGQALVSVDDPEDGRPRLLLRDLRTWSDTAISGLPDDVETLGFDSTGRIPLVLDSSRDETGVPARNDVSLFAVAAGSAYLLWRGRGQSLPEPMLTSDGRYLLTHPYYDDAALLLVALDGSGSVAIPVPGDVANADPVRLIPGTTPPSSHLALPGSVTSVPGTAIDGAPSLVVTSLEQDAAGRATGHIRLLSPSTGGVLVLAETTVPIPPGTRADRVEAAAVPRPGHRDLLILSGWWTEPWVFRWTPGRAPRRVRSLGGYTAVYGPMWSPDGRRLAVRVGSSGRRYALFDGALRLQRTISLPRRWENATLVGWTADSQRLVFDPPTIAYAGPIGGIPLCENQMPMATLSIATGTLRTHRSVREMALWFGPGADARAATGEWTTVADDGRSLAFEHGCPAKVTRSSVTVPGRSRVHEVTWSVDGLSLFVLTGQDRPGRLLAYRRPWSDPRQEPRTTRLDELVLYLGPVAPEVRWVVVYGESRLDGRSAGLLDLRSGRVHWIEGAVRVQGWTDGR